MEIEGEQREQEMNKFNDVNDSEEFTIETKFHVPVALYGGLIGRDGKTKRRIETESNVKIVIPRSRKKQAAMIIIQGRSEADIDNAKENIGKVVLSLRKRCFPTHFICVPAISDMVIRSFNQIKENILADNYAGIDELLFIDSAKIHITFAPCSLLDSVDRKKAVEIFKDCSREFIDSKVPIEINIRGLRKFDDNSPEKVKVLFAGVESPPLQIFANNVMKSFKNAQLCFEDRSDVVKLHMTVINSKYRLKVNPKAAKMFDATKILQKYSDYDFGSFSAREVHLSEMGTKDESGFYKALCFVKI